MEVHSQGPHSCFRPRLGPISRMWPTPLHSPIARLASCAPECYWPNPHYWPSLPCACLWGDPVTTGVLTNRQNPTGDCEPDFRTHLCHWPIRLQQANAAVHLHAPGLTPETDLPCHHPWSDPAATVVHANSQSPPTNCLVGLNPC